jgi:TPR repeat protein
MLCIGECYLEGLGVTKSSTTAIKFLKQAADAGDVTALIELGDVLFIGNQLEAAFGYYQKAADTGDNRALTALGFCYSNGWGTAQDWNSAVVWWRKGAKAGNPRAMYCMGLLAADGTKVRFNPQAATNWFRKSSEAGFAPATEELKRIQKLGWAAFESGNARPTAGDIRNLIGVAASVGNWLNGSAGPTDTRDPIEAKMENFHRFTGH